MFSIDTKKKEFLGQLHRPGEAYAIEPIQAFDRGWASRFT